MVRANRPGRALLGLSKLLVGAFGTAAFALTTETIWQMGDALGGLRLTVVMLLGLAALVAWLIVAHDLWEKPDRETSAELARLFNVGTVLTLTLATAVSYVVLFAGTLFAASLLIDTSVLQQTLQRPVHVSDYLTLAWIISSLATVGGAIGSGMEDEETVRAAAYGYHPGPGGWRDEKSG
jgi:Ca2+/Na+ antiporter